jgi:DNA-damage-inducible protein J
MATKTFSVRLDSEIKEEFDRFCYAVGMNATTAFNLFARAVVREQRIPFDIKTGGDPFYGERNMEHLLRVKADAEAGRNMSFHELIENEDDE